MLNPLLFSIPISSWNFYFSNLYFWLLLKLLSKYNIYRNSLFNLKHYHKIYLQIILQTVIWYHYNYLWISLSKLLLLYVLSIKQFFDKLKTMNLLVWLKRTYNREWILCLIFKHLFVNRIIQWKLLSLL